MSHAPCPICAAPRHQTERWRGFTLYHCPSCGSESVDRHPTADELHAFYQAMSGKKMIHDTRRLDKVRRAFDGYLDLYSKATGGARPERFLDLGGGVGYYARAAHERGIESWLVDWAFDALLFARQRLELPWRVMTDVGRCAGTLGAERFDFVLARHVIEHLHDPADFLRHIARVLRAGGLLELETPNVASYEQLAHPGVMVETYRVLRRSNPDTPRSQLVRRALAKSPSGINPPKHLWGFTARGLGHLLAATGFEIVSVRRPVAGDPIYDPLYYDLTRVRGGVAERLMAVLERLATLPFHGRGMHLAILARRLPEATP